VKTLRRIIMMVILTDMLIVAAALNLSGCTQEMGGTDPSEGTPVINMPFEAGTSWLCTQGAKGTYSHKGNATMFDVDFDTPNLPSEMARLYAPVSGVAYTISSSTGFGNHINIDIGNGTYAIIAHMSQAAVITGQFVEMGEYIGRAGCSGNCSGTHVHFGVHSGDASKNGAYGKSIEANILAADITSGKYPEPISTEDLICGLVAGHKYQSQLPNSYNGEDQYLGNEPEDPQNNGQENGQNQDNTTGDEQNNDANNGDDQNPEDDQNNDQEDSQGQGANPYYDAFLCWIPEGLVNPRNGILEVADVTWWTLDEHQGPFTELCGNLQVESGDNLIVNGSFQADNIPQNSSWICANTETDGMQMSGRFLLDGVETYSSIQTWGSGCDIALEIP